MANSKRRCLNCKGYFAQDIMISTPVGFFDSHKCLVGYAQAAKSKNLAKRTREQKERLKTRSEWIKDAQKVVNQWVRVRDQEKKCISCTVSNTTQSQWDAGHFRSVGSSPHLRFYTLNIYKQCKHCNNYLSGNALSYRASLVNKFGADHVERIESLNFDNKPSIDYLKRLIKVFKGKIKLYNRLFRNKN